MGKIELAKLCRKSVTWVNGQLNDVYQHLGFIRFFTVLGEKRIFCLSRFHLC